MAGALDPLAQSASARSGVTVEDAFMGNSRRDANAGDIRAALDYRAAPIIC